MNALILSKIHYNYINFRLKANHPGKQLLEKKAFQEEKEVCYSLLMEDNFSS